MTNINIPLKSIITGNYSLLINQLLNPSPLNKDKIQKQTSGTCSDYPTRGPAGPARVREMRRLRDLRHGRGPDMYRVGLYKSGGGEQLLGYREKCGKLLNDTLGQLLKLWKRNDI